MLMKLKHLIATRLKHSKSVTFTLLKKEQVILNMVQYTDDLLYPF